MAVEAFGDRWSLLVLRDVMFANRRHFRELVAGSEEKIASNILADRLRRLTDADLLTRDNAGPRTAGHLQPHRSGDPARPGTDPSSAPGESGTAPRLRVHAELLANGGLEMQAQFMEKLRETHLATQPGQHPPPGDRTPCQPVTRLT